MQTQSNLNAAFLKSLCPDENKHLPDDFQKMPEKKDTSVEQPYYSPTGLVVDYKKIEDTYRNLGERDPRTGEWTPLPFEEGDLYPAGKKKADEVNGGGNTSDNDKEDKEEEKDPEGTVYPQTPAEAVAAIKAGGYVKLTDDMVVPDNKSLTFSKLSSEFSTNGSIEGVSLDLGGNTISGYGGTRGDTVEIQKSNVILKNGKIVACDNYVENGAVIAVMGDSNVTLENLEVTGERCVWSTTANNTVTINSGTYTSPNSAPAIYMSKAGSKITINGGRYEAQPYSNGTYYTINLLDSLVADGTDVKTFIEIKGGEFVNYNPAKSMADPHGPNSYVPEGYTTGYYIDGDDTIYVVRDIESFNGQIPETTVENGKTIYWT